MRIDFLIGFCCCVLFHSSAFAADEAPGKRAENDLSRAADLLKNGNAGGAYELYMRLLRETPDDDAVNLGLARAAVSAKRWNQAVLAYENLLEKYPREAPLYGELAHVYMLLGDRAAAERSLAVMRSLDGGTSREETTKTLDLLEARYNDFQLHGKVRAGVLYDSNANLGPNSGTLDLGSWRVQLDDAKSRETLGAYLGANLDMTRRVHRDSPWHLVGDAHGFWRGNTESDLRKTHTRESQYGRMAGGIWHQTAATLSEARLKAEVFDYALYQRVAAYGAEGTFIQVADASTHLIFKGGLDRREYSRDALRDGLYAYAGMYGRFFLGADKHELLVGGRVLGADARRKDYRYDGWEATARFVFKLPRGVELAPSLSWAREDYRGPATALETQKRWDERLRAGLYATYRIDESLSLEASYQYTRNRSASALYDYRQHYFNAGLVWSF